MKFHNWGWNPQTLKTAKSVEELEDLIDRRVRFIQIRDKDNPIEQINNQVAFECGFIAWKFDKRPYYSIYPKIVDSLIKTKLDIPVEKLNYPTSTSTLLIRLAEGHELGGEVSTIFVSRAVKGRTKEVIHITAMRTDSNLEVLTVFCPQGDTIENALSNNTTFHCDPELIGMQSHTEQIMRLALGVALLDNDPELIVPDILDNDKHKLNELIPPERLAQLANKAQRRGKVGWVIGQCTDEKEDSEVSAHYRRGHYGFRWAGPGKCRLKWTKIKGSIIHKDKLTEVPTGYLDKEQPNETTS